MNQFLTYLFWPNPGNANYGSPKAMALIIVCVFLVLASFGVSYWRKKVASTGMKRVSGSWPAALLWFGLSGLFLVVARAEQIQFLAMRFLWVTWALVALLYVFFQWKRFSMRYYEVLPTEKAADPRAEYLPKRKKKR